MRLILHFKQTGLNEYVYYFSADFGIINVDDILVIHNYLIDKNDIE